MQRYRIILRSALLAGLLSLAGRAASPLGGPEGPLGGPEGLLVTVTVDKPSGAAYREGEELRVTVAANRDCFLHLVYCDAAGACTLIFPNGSSDPAGGVRGGAPVQLGQGGFTFEITAPFGAEMLRAYAAGKPLRTPSGTTVEGGAKLLDGGADEVDVYYNDEAARVKTRLVSTTLLLRTEGRAPVAQDAGGGRESAVTAGEPSAADDTPEIYALVVGVSRYRSKTIKPLRYAERDARLMADYLTAPDGAGIAPERIRVLTDEQATREAILGSMRDFLAATGPNDIVFLYFAGHGLTSPRDQATYFLGCDAETDALSTTAVDQAEVARLLTERIHAGKIVFFLDACHGGGLGLTGVRLRGAGTVLSRRLLAEMVTKKNGTVFLTASRAMEQSFEGEEWGGGHGAFTHYLVEGLRGGADADRNRRVTVDELAAFLTDRVKADTNGLQHPELKGFFDNNLVLSVLP